jgi:biopolymer transport protein ExbB/TolQ
MKRSGLHRRAVGVRRAQDWEQESAIILALWAVAVVVYKARQTMRERRLLERDLVHVPEGMRILPEDVREHARPLEALPPAEAQSLLPRALLVALHRFGATRNVQDVSEAARGVCEAEADRLDSELSMLRYVAWAIPAIGFIGTVRGIGDALGEAHRPYRATSPASPRASAWRSTRR